MLGMVEDFSPALFSLTTNLIHKTDELVGVSIPDLVHSSLLVSTAGLHSDRSDSRLQSSQHKASRIRRATADMLPSQAIMSPSFCAEIRLHSETMLS